MPRRVDHAERRSVMPRRDAKRGEGKRKRVEGKNKNKGNSARPYIFSNPNPRSFVASSQFVELRVSTSRQGSVCCRDEEGGRSCLPEDDGGRDAGPGCG